MISVPRNENNFFTRNNIKPKCKLKIKIFKISTSKKEMYILLNSHFTNSRNHEFTNPKYVIPKTFKFELAIAYFHVCLHLHLSIYEQTHTYMHKSKHTHTHDEYAYAQEHTNKQTN